ncbi:conserved hypothetical protein [Pseudomonas sp. 8Z]|uniref:hypothetical protein n=1 Tax=Pseudomonas sp. 8Z TaxID=2653166 RepID=UPI0012F269BC|nr:hypothetical protein [Pseudomonas sp. 8Z]VXC27049.1 conserved hypothetical protein [Pseudomonas sp. 8Z]
MPKKKSLSEKEIAKLESMIPDVAVRATRSAHSRALSTGMAVMGVLGRDLVETSADGSVRIVGKAKPRRKVTVGQVVTVQRMA